MKLFFKNSEGNVTLIADKLTSKTLTKAINDFLTSNGWSFDEYPYRRFVGIGPKKTMIDFGSHDSFLYVNSAFKTVCK